MILIALGATAGVFLLTRAMHKLSLRAGLGVAVGFIFFMMVQMASFPMWLGISQVTVVFIASLFGTRIFLRSLMQEEREEEDRVRRESNSNLFDGGYSDLNPSARSGNPR
jgi:hypothetical protein